MTDYGEYVIFYEADLFGNRTGPETRYVRSDVVERLWQTAKQVVDAEMALDNPEVPDADKVRLSQVMTEGHLLLAELVYPRAQPTEEAGGA